MSIQCNMEMRTGIPMIFIRFLFHNINRKRHRRWYNRWNKKNRFTGTLFPIGWRLDNGLKPACEVSTYYYLIYDNRHPSHIIRFFYTCWFSFISFSFPFFVRPFLFFICLHAIVRLFALAFPHFPILYTQKQKC